MRPGSERAFFLNCTGIREATVPASAVLAAPEEFADPHGNERKTIGAGALAGCAQLTSLTAPAVGVLGGLFGDTKGVLAVFDAYGLHGDRRLGFCRFHRAPRDRSAGYNNTRSSVRHILQTRQIGGSASVISGSICSRRLPERKGTVPSGKGQKSLPTRCSKIVRRLRKFRFRKV